MGILENYFVGKNFIVAGMGTGQGMSTAKLIEKLGGHVIALSRSGRAPLGIHENIESIKCDMGNREDVRNLSYEIRSRGMKINGLVNNAGKWEMSSEKLVSPEKLIDFFNSNVNTQYTVLMGLIDCMAEKSSIVNIGASRNLLKNNNSGYSISKYAIEEMTKIAASALRGRSIRVNAVLPGSVHKDDNFEEKFPFSFMDEGEFLEPLEIAYVSLFLLSPLSYCINGQCITSDRGLDI
jgi:NAD(P)-dependent dehydrogenase (short-subunit alcohol dehydrogenase family)